MKRLRDILLIYIPTGFLLLSLSLVLAYRWVPVKWTPLMLVRTIENSETEGYVNKQNWVCIDNVSPAVIEAILMAEDQRFFSHNGFDWIELAKMKGEHDKFSKPVRGCSTISQQVAKNCFTFGSHTWMRKAIEAYYTVLIETLWGKERILEVYLNVAETGRGLFGVESACQRFFGCSASDVTIDDAAALACVLPKPLTRTPSSVMNTHTTKYRKLCREVENLLTESCTSLTMYKLDKQ
jgi:monofunctional biosynthetic peptidoglycan transglycosylase